MTPRWRSVSVVFVVATFLGAVPALAGQTLRGKNLYFGDAHWHSCLSQDAERDAGPDAQYASMLYDYGLDFSLESDHAEAASAPIFECDPRLPRLPDRGHGGEEIASAMKAAADDWYGEHHETPAGP
ncbi:MAG TPA: hypothetical protein VGS03_11335, partial [Candidatus Polarisedimenticolia bacterium]|nr:hypothetical protein [Candidatus Polarisedimenticolia bacterium]